MTGASDHFDTYLLRVFCTLVAEGSVSRTAIKLNQSQPAISNALKRLRELFKDPLLVRDKGRMVPTEQALALLPSARVALSEIDNLLFERELFEASTTEQEFRLGSPDYLSVVFLADVVRRLRREAPFARLQLRPLGPDFDYEKALAEGELDIVIGNWPHPPPQLRLSTILIDQIVCLMSRDHPLADGGLTAEAYLQASHVVPLPYSVSRHGVVETYLASLRVKRNTTVVLPYFNMAPYLLPGTDLIFTTSRHFARYYARFLPLAIVASPFDFPPMRFYQLWHDRNHYSSGHRWFRDLLTRSGRSALSSAGSKSDNSQRLDVT